MNIKELNAINLMVVRDVAQSEGISRCATLFGCEIQVADVIKNLSDIRIRELVETVDVALFSVRPNKTGSFWRDAISETKDVDWANVTRMRSLLLQDAAQKMI